MSQDFRLYGSAEVWNQEMQLGQKNLLRALIDFWPPGVSSALDVGCGDGKLTRVLAAETGIQIIGFDSSAEALSRISLPSIQGDAANMPFENASFDLVFSTDTLEHVPDETHDQVWAELFRVARNQVLVAVPFREELLDATAKCPSCSNTYHVNWHQRSYDFADIYSKTPPGWHVQTTVISGESWPDILPTETRLRRTILDQWSGWGKAVCPHCGAPGCDPNPSARIPSLTAAALGQQIYASLVERRVWRSHTEILVVFGRTPKPPPPQLSTPMQRSCLSTQIEPAVQHAHLVAYPQVARCVKAIGSGVIIQFPIYGHVESLNILRKPGSTDPVHIRLEDAVGTLYSGSALSTEQAEASITLPRKPIPCDFGVLLETESQDSIGSLQLGTGPEVFWFSPAKGKEVSYHHFGDEKSELYVQITDHTWLDHSLLAPTGKTSSPLIADLLVRIDVLSAEQQGILRQQLQTSAKEADRLAVAIQNLEAERDALRTRAEEADRLAVAIQNLEAERDALRTRAGETDRLAVTIQNLEAERDALLQQLYAANTQYADLRQVVERIQDRLEHKLGDVVRRALKKNASRDID